MFPGTGAALRYGLIVFDIVVIDLAVALLLTVEFAARFFLQPHATAVASPR